jgi:hypothetical protein
MSSEISLSWSLATYIANVKCWYDNSMTFHVWQVSGDEPGYPHFYSASGTISGGSQENIRLPGHSDREIAALLDNPH